MQQIEFRAMGCHMLAVLDSSSAASRQLLESVPGWFASWEQQLSRFRSDSELNRLNASAGTPMQVSPLLWELLQLARYAAQRSDGLVTPTILDALEAAGYSHSFSVGETGSAPMAQMARVWPRTTGTVDWRAIKLEPRQRSVWVPPGVRLDLGGIAKGWAAQEAMRRLSHYGPALLDAGGDIAISGPMADGSPWPIGIAEPIGVELASPALPMIALAAGGVATSGRDYRRWQQGGRWQHHIIDPRSGQPATSDVLSVTVIATSVIDAEIGAKTALILGSQAGLDWIEAQPTMAGLLINTAGHVLMSQCLRSYLCI